MNRYYKEVWKPIEGYEELYEVSCFGRVRSLSRNTTKGKILKLGYNKDGYNQVCLYKNGKKKTYRLCRIVAKAFVENPNNLPEVNHIDKDVKNDDYINLEWCDRTYNVNYSKARKVMRIKDDETVIYSSIYDTRHDGFNYGNVNRCCKTGGKHKGYEWKYI